MKYLTIIILALTSFAFGQTGTVNPNGVGIVNPAFRNAVLPTQTGQSGKHLRTDGTNATWETVTAGTTYTAGTGITLPGNAITLSPADNAFSIAKTSGLQTALDGKESSKTQFFDDFSRYSNGSTLLNDGTSLPMIGPAWRINEDTTGGGVATIITGGGFGDTNSRLWYIGSVVDTPTDKFSFGCETIALPTGAGSVTPYSMNMSFSRREMLTTPAQAIIPAGVMHINTSLTGISDINYFPDPFTSVGATDICTSTNGNHGMITGDPILLSGVNLPSGVSVAQTAYAIVLTTTTFKLATTYGNAIAGTAIDIGTNGGVACYFQITDITCLNRTISGSSYSYHPTVKQEHNKNGMAFALLVEMDGEILKVSRSGVGTIVFRIPSLSRRTGSQMHFWYESSGLLTSATQTAYGKITKAWAQAPAMDRQFLAEQNIDREVIRGGSATTSALNLYATSSTSPTSAAQVKLWADHDSLGLTINPTGQIGIGSWEPVTTANFPQVQVVGATTQGAMCVADGLTNNTNKVGTINAVDYNNTSWGTWTMLRGASTSTANVVTIGGGHTGGVAASEVKIATGSFRTTTGTDRFKIDAAGAVTITGDTLILATAKTPASATATGVTGQIARDADYIYICTATNTWKRAAIATW